MPLAQALAWHQAARLVSVYARTMLAGLLLHGMFLVSFLLVYSRWFDDALTAEVCFLGLVLELGGALLLAHYAQATNCIFFCHFGTIETPAPLLT